MRAQVLKLENLRVKFPGGIEAVRGLSMDVEPGLIHAVVGESGCGKSVTCRALMGLLPEAADVSWSIMEITGRDFRSGDGDGRSMAAIRGRHAAMVFQEPGKHLNPALTAGSFLVEVIRRHRPDDRADNRAEARCRAAELLEMVGMDPRKVLGSYPHELSGGMKQRVLIAAAISGGPELLIADEPTTALDASTQARILGLIMRLRDELGMAVLLVTHDFGVVRSTADVVSVMRAGRIVERAPAGELFSRPGHAYTRGLLRAIPRISNRGRRLESADGEGRDASVIPWGTGFHPGGGRAEGSRAEDNQAEDSPAGSTGRIHGMTNREDAVMRPILEVRGLHKVHRSPSATDLRKRSVHAVRGVSFTVRRNEVLGIVGESGSGKTTLARALLHLDAPGSGRVRFDGRDMGKFGRRDWREFRRQAQIVFQHPESALNPRMRIGAVLTEGLKAGGVPLERREKRIGELLDMVGLSPALRDRRPHEFAGGEKQRIVIARALAVEPKLLILDEPVSSLDVSIQAQIINLLMDLKSALGLTYVLISHDLNIVGYIADRIGVMKAGEIVELGDAESLLAGPNHAYTRSLFADSLTIDTRKNRG